MLKSPNTACFAKNVVCHPIRTIGEVAQALGTVVCAAGKVIGVPVKLGALCIAGNTEQAPTDLQKVYEHTKFFMQECALKIAAMSNREIAKQTTAFATDWVLAGKVLALTHRLCSRAGPLITEVFEVLKKESAVEYAVAGSEGILHHMSETAKHVGGAVKEVIKNNTTVIAVISCRIYGKTGT